MGSLSVTIDPEAGISKEYDEFILDWMADIYVYIQWKYGIWSAELAEKLKPDELYEKYYPLHEASLENGIEKLVKIYNLSL